MQTDRQEEVIKQRKKDNTMRQKQIKRRAENERQKEIKEHREEDIRKRINGVSEW